MPYEMPYDQNPPIYSAHLQADFRFESPRSYADQTERACPFAPFRITEFSADMGVSMRVAEYVVPLWRMWCDLRRFRWEDVAGSDYHKWESNMEIDPRLASFVPRSMKRTATSAEAKCSPGAEDHGPPTARRTRGL